MSMDPVVSPEAVIILQNLTIIIVGTFEKVDDNL